MVNDGQSFIANDLDETGEVFLSFSAERQPRLLMFRA